MAVERAGPGAFLANGGGQQSSLLNSSSSLLNSGSSASAKRTTSTSVVGNSSTAARQQSQNEAYLSELLGYSLERLRKEPDLLQEEKAQVERSLQTTAVTQYGAFISTAKCLETISTELSSVCEHLDLLLDGIPELAASCESFSQKSAQVLEQHAQNKHLASSQSSLVELLEVPQLMDTCVRNGVYDEALDLQAFVSRMGLLHPEVPLIKLLLAQVAEVGQTMLQQLLSRLRASIQLPECLRVMGYLRRIAAFTEPELRLQFLQCRDDWVSSLVDELDDSDSYEYVKHLTDIYRIHLFDAVMQYRAIFFDGSSTSASAATARAGAGAAGAQGSVAGAGGAGVQDAAALAMSVKESSMLHSWVQHRLSLYLDALRTHLPNITEGGNLSSVLEHCMYCGSSLARVGLDFQALLHPMFEACALNLLTQHLAAAVEGFNTRLEAHKWVSMPAPSLKSRDRAGAAAGGRTSGSGVPVGDSERPGSNSGSAAQAGSSGQEGQGGKGGEGGGSGGGSEDLSPPYILMEHLPLAVFTNGALTALNEFRHCTLLSLGRPAAGLLQQALEAAAASLMHYRHTHALSEGDVALFRSAVKTMLDVLLPYLASCYGRVFTGGAYKLDVSSAANILRTVLQEA